VYCKSDWRTTALRLPHRTLGASALRAAVSRLANASTTRQRRRLPSGPARQRLRPWAHQQRKGGPLGPPRHGARGRRRACGPAASAGAFSHPPCRQMPPPWVPPLSGSERRCRTRGGRRGGREGRGACRAGARRACREKWGGADTTGQSGAGGCPGWWWGWRWSETWVWEGKAAQKARRGCLALESKRGEERRRRCAVAAGRAGGVGGNGAAGPGPSSKARLFCRVLERTGFLQTALGSLCRR